MQHRPLGPSGINASVVAFGAWAIGGWRWGGSDTQDAIDAIHAALDAGINLIDTAPMYGFGHSEELVGKAIRGRRDKLLIATKCGLRWDRQEGKFHFASQGHSVHRYLAPDSIGEELEASLKRLGTDYIDLYQTHWQEPTTPIADTMGELVKFRDQGKIRAIGVCNATPQEMDAYRAVGSLDTSQDRYSMLDRAQDQQNLPYCAEHGLGFLAYSPLAQGLLTGKVDPQRQFPEGDQRRDNPRFSQDNRARVADLLQVLQPIADAHGASMEQLVLAWTLTRPGLSHVLAGARTPAQAISNARAGQINLSPEDISAIDTAVEQKANLVI